MIELGPLQKQWIAALRSGKYEQGFRRLRNVENEYCCLGVACAVLKLPYRLEGLAYTYLSAADSSDAVLPDDAWWRLGLRSRSGSLREAILTDEHICTALYHLNDLLEWSFEQIADYIEANPETSLRGQHD